MTKGEAIEYFEDLHKNGQWCVMIDHIVKVINNIDSLDMSAVNNKENNDDSSM